MSGLGSLGKDKLIFDPAYTSDGDNAGSYTRSGASGALITNHDLQRTPALSFGFLDADVSILNDTVTEASHGAQTGDKIQLTTTGVLPAGLALLTDYYIIRVDANTIKFASSQANAEAGIAVDITATTGGGTHTVTGFEQEVRALDVWIVNDLPITTKFEYDEDSGHSTGDKGAFMLAVRHDADTSMVNNDGDYAPLQVDENGNLKVIADLDVNFDYVYAEDTTHVDADLGAFILAVRQDTLVTSVDNSGDYAAFKLNSRGGLWTVPVGTVDDDAVDTENPVKIGFRAYAGPLGAVAAGDRVNAASDLYRRLYTNNGANIGIKAAAATVSTAAAVLPTALSGRRTIMIKNNSAKPIYIGENGSVTIASGFPIAAGGFGAFDIGPDVSIYAIGEQASQNIRLFEMA